MDHAAPLRDFDVGIVMGSTNWEIFETEAKKHPGVCNLLHLYKYDCKCGEAECGRHQIQWLASQVGKELFEKFLTHCESINIETPSEAIKILTKTINCLIREANRE